jgi:hypothetical protein
MTNTGLDTLSLFNDAAATGEISSVVFSRAFAMPSADTFSIPPISNFVHRYHAQRIADSVQTASLGQ